MSDVGASATRLAGFAVAVLSLNGTVAGTTGAVLVGALLLAHAALTRDAAALFAASGLTHLLLAALSVATPLWVALSIATYCCGYIVSLSRVASTPKSTT